ncbi:MAG: DUF2845 domain-containing protein [Gammaproteobacteria bacterium]
MRWQIFLASLFFLAFSNSSYAALRCGNSLIDIGDYKGDVLRLCGPPAIKERHYGVKGQELRDFGNTLEFNRYEQVTIDEWIYNFGPRRLQQYLRFENGVLREIRDLGYGY